jgi:hypothetical protein
LRQSDAVKIACRTDSLIDAHLRKGLLESGGIRVHLGGEYLSGALGEMPPFGLYVLWVDDADLAAARALLAELDPAAPAPPDEPSELLA